MNYVWRTLLLAILKVENVIGQCFHIVTICNSVFCSTSNLLLTTVMEMAKMTHTMALSTKTLLRVDSQ